MLDYEWGNPSTIMFTGAEEPVSQPDPTRQIFDHYSQTFTETGATYLNPNDFFQNPTHFLPNPTHFAPLYDPRAYDCPYQQPPPPAAMEPETGFMLMPKTEPVGAGVEFAIGLNLGGRTYFSSAVEDDFVSRLYRRARPVDGGGGLVSSPRCQAEGCNADLTHAKHYHRRHKVCEFHSKAATVVTAGLTQRFCQQCSRFHLLTEFDNGKRSCRKRLADHNRRRRKSSQNQDHSKALVTVSATQNSSSDNTSRCKTDSET